MKKYLVSLLSILFILAGLNGLFALDPDCVDVNWCDYQEDHSGASPTCANVVVGDCELNCVDDGDFAAIDGRMFLWEAPTSNPPWPVVILLHGGGVTAQQWFKDGLFGGSSTKDYKDALVDLGYFVIAPYADFCEVKDIANEINEDNICANSEWLGWDCEPFWRCFHPDDNSAWDCQADLDFLGAIVTGVKSQNENAIGTGHDGGDDFDGTVYISGFSSGGSMAMFAAQDFAKNDIEIAAISTNSSGVEYLDWLGQSSWRWGSNGVEEIDHNYPPTLIAHGNNDELANPLFSVNYSLDLDTMSIPRCVCMDDDEYNSWWLGIYHNWIGDWDVEDREPDNYNEYVWWVKRGNWIVIDWFANPGDEDYCHEYCNCYDCEE